jgi:hypothetical protein
MIAAQLNADREVTAGVHGRDSDTEDSHPASSPASHSGHPCLLTRTCLTVSQARRVAG